MATDPICGMAVDEATSELKLFRDNRTFYFCSGHCLREFAEPARELGRLRQRLAVAWPLSLVVAFLTYAQPWAEWPVAALGLATVVQFYPGWTFLRGTVEAARNRSWSMDVLIGVGTTTAYGFSLLALLLPSRLPHDYFFDASTLIVTLILTGNYLEHFTRERARRVLRRLQEVLPTTATVLKDGAEVSASVTDLVPGDRLRIRPGDRIPVDGRVVTGRSAVDESVLTGESLPVSREPGQRVLAGSINQSGLLEIEASEVGQDTALAQIGQLVAEAETSHVPLQKLADRIAAVFVPVVLGLAVAAAVGWGLTGAAAAIVLLVFVSVVITACPCAFGIATPAAIVVGTGRAAEMGILFKGRESLERASRVQVLLTDKTGTLTRGLPTLTDVLPVPGRTRAEVLAAAASVEVGSSHPLARAVVATATLEGCATNGAVSIEVEPGRGVRGRIDGALVEVLQGDAFDDEEGERGWSRGVGEDLARRGRAWSVVVRDGAVIGVLGFFDDVLEGAAQAVQELKAEGIEVVMVTGDNRLAAEAVAQATGITEVHAGVSPAGKLDLIREFQRSGRTVGFVGDGINDAPALSAADLGIAVGSGTDVAREAGGVILLRARFEGVGTALKLGRRTVRKVRGNLVWALGYNAVLLPVAMGALVPFFGLSVFQVLPISGAAAMGLSSTTVMLNSLSLRWAAL